ncbi:hypothetical protein D3C72_2347920 [compost metagenome]
MPAVRMMSGKGTRKTKIAMKAAAAIPIISLFFSARPPMRKTAWTTTASTAAFNPKNSPSIRPTLPKAA